MKRRKARELALAFLYQMEIRDELNKFSEDVINSFLKEQCIEDEEIADFTRLLIKGTIKNLPVIDEKISGYSINWSIKRMPYIDRNIMRLAIYEMLFVETIPELVSINEAIELAKKYSTKESSKFVNGILHRIKEEYARKIKTAPVEEDGKR
ncbi:MAG: transcription antitermination factor NusB [Candidatus Omnitrophica bacterium]|nr:transcription antitermination factor NusB [Candidatus Omnitrophota bacterium]MCM8777500.1 transcription antitermination factor NusB [Candidatus Omnitrophota bacterium]